MARFIVNKSGTVHSIPDEWFDEKIASGYREATAEEVSAWYAGQGLAEPSAADNRRVADASRAEAERNRVLQATVVGPRPGDVDVRLTGPGDPGFIVGADGMRQAPSRITADTLNTSGAAVYSTNGISEQDAHNYEVVVPEVAEVSIRAELPVEAGAKVQAVQDGNPVVQEPTAVGGVPVAGASSDPAGGNPSGAQAEADAAKAKADADAAKNKK